MSAPRTDHFVLLDDVPMLTADEMRRRIAAHDVSARERERRAKIPERPAHWPWLHGATVPVLSPAQVADRRVEQW